MQKIGLLVLLIGIVVLPLGAHAQKQNNIWYFGYRAGLDFNGGSPVELTNSAMYSWEGCASVSDPRTGALLFYTGGNNHGDWRLPFTQVWNRNHQKMPHSDSLFGQSSSTQSALVIPMTGDTSRYYIFTADQGGYFDNPKGINYSIVDMTLDGGLGDVMKKNINLLDTPATEKLTAVRNCNGKSVWVIGHGGGNNNFYAWLVTGKGIESPIVSSVGLIHKNNSSDPPGYFSIGYLKASPDGKKLAAALSFLYKVEVFDFDNSTGIVSNPMPLAYPAKGPYGIAFSPDNSKLFTASPSKLHQYDLHAGGGNPDSIALSIKQIHLEQKNGMGALQLGPDGKIYVTYFSAFDTGQSFLGVINNPNATGNACNFLKKGFVLKQGKTANGLPNFMEAFPDPAPVVLANFSITGFDLGSPTTFADASTNAFSWEWNFGDPLSGASNTSTSQNPTHTFQKTGTYQVTLIVKNNCYTDTLTKTIVIKTLQTCPRPQAVNGTKPGEVSSISILLTNSEWAKNSSSISVQVKFDHELLSVVNTPTSSFGDITGYNPDRGSGNLSFTLKINKQLDTPDAELARIPVQALLAPKRKGTVEVTTSIITQQGGNTITTAGCSDTFLLDESCVLPEQLQDRSKVSIISLYPNPSSHSSTLLIESTNESSVLFELVDVFGRSIRKEEKILTHGQNQFTFSTENYSAGIYFCRITNGNTMETTSLSIQK